MLFNRMNVWGIADMVKLIIVDRKKLKISPQEHREMLKKDKVAAKILEEEERRFEEDLRKLKEEKNPCH